MSNGSGSASAICGAGVRDGAAVVGLGDGATDAVGGMAGEVDQVGRASGDAVGWTPPSASCEGAAADVVAGEVSGDAPPGMHAPTRIAARSSTGMTGTDA